MALGNILHLLTCFLLMTNAQLQKTGTEPTTGTGNPTVHLKQGTAIGKLLTSTGGKEFSAFLGIPFGNVTQRFESPEPAGPWIGVFNATIDGPACKQDVSSFDQGITGQEDCLIINVYVGKNVSKKLPVLVFLYGGGFMIGQGISTVYRPELLMNKDIILAIPNYRVGAFGFLSTGDEAAPGNYGLLDQVLALTWLQDNIESFGGDPNKVTLFGESAGGVSVMFHVVSPLSKGLFHAAISQSGSPSAPWALMRNPLNSAKKIAENSNCTTETSAELVACLRKVKADDLVRAANFTSIEGIWAMTTGPVLENPSYGKFLTEMPLKLLQEGRFNKVPLISGITADESITFIKNLENITLFDGLTDIDTNEEKWDSALHGALSFHWDKSGFSKEDLHKIKKRYFEGVNLTDEFQFIRQMSAMSSDALFNSPNDETVKLVSAAGVPTYMYVLDHSPPFKFETNYSGKRDVPHGVDLAYLFNITMFFSYDVSDEEDDKLSNELVDMWANFADTHNPTPDGKPVEWFPTPPGEIKYLSISTDSKMKDGYRTEEMEFWHDINFNQ